MTEQEQTEETATETTELTGAAAAAETADAPSERDDDDDDDDDEDEKKSKKKKKKKDKDKDKDEEKDEPKKQKIEFEAGMPRNEAISYFEAIIGGLRSGRLEFKQGDKSLVLNPPDRLEIEVKAQSKGDKGRVVFEIAWSNEHQTLDISN